MKFADDKPQDPPISGAAVVLVFTGLAFAAVMPGCGHTPEAIAYNTVGVMSKGAKGAVEQLPHQCQKAMREAALAPEVASAPDPNTAGHAAVKVVAERCRKAETGLKVANEGLKFAITEIDQGRVLKEMSKDAVAYLVFAYKTYRALVPVLKPLGINLPEVP